MPNKFSELGKKFIVEPAGTELTAKEAALLRELQPAGIIVRKRNFAQDIGYDAWLARFRRLLDQCREAIGRERIIVSIDHEGGRVIRPPKPITPFPYAAFWAGQARQVGKAMAIELKSLGVNVNYAPVADIHSNPDNPVINERAFGTTPDMVAEAAVKFARAMREQGITPCAKHFPGHGDTKDDSHFGLPVLNSTLDELKQRELIPFQTLVDDDIPLVMTAHILFPKIDAENQATLSVPILKDLLRKRMGFKGVVIADALGMAAIAGKLSDNQTVSKAVSAGLDIFLVVGDAVDIERALEMARNLESARQQGSLAMDALEESLGRIDAFLKNLPQHAVQELDKTVFARHAELAAELAKGKPWSEFELSLPGFE